MPTPKRFSMMVAAPLVRSLDEAAVAEAKKQPMVLNDEAVRERVNKEYGVDVGTAHVPELLEENAVFLHPSESRPYLRKVLRRKYVPEALKEELRTAGGRHGLILTGKNMKRRGALEHEYGHAIAAEKGGVLERLVAKPWVMQQRGLYHKAPSIFAALAAGKRGIGLSYIRANSQSTKQYTLVLQ